MSPITYMSIEAQMQDISLQNRKATVELEAMLDQQPEFTDKLPEPSQRDLPNWISFAVLAAISGTVGLMAGIALF